MAVITVKFNSIVQFSEYSGVAVSPENGVTITNTTTGEDFQITATSGSGTDTVTYTGTWVSEPAAGGVVVWNYDGTGDYADPSKVTDGEAVQNFDFATGDLTSWTTDIAESTTITVDTNRVRLARNGSASHVPAITQSISGLVVGVPIDVSFELINDLGSPFGSTTLVIGATSIWNSEALTAGVHSRSYTPAAETETLSMQSRGSTNSVHLYDYISVGGQVAEKLAATTITLTNCADANDPVMTITSGERLKYYV